MHPQQLWGQLTASQRQQLCVVLSEMVARRLSLARKEVTHEPR